jgi:hypothetical protein
LFIVFLIVPSTKEQPDEQQADQAGAQRPGKKGKEQGKAVGTPIRATRTTRGEQVLLQNAVGLGQHIVLADRRALLAQHEKRLVKQAAVRALNADHSSVAASQQHGKALLIWIVLTGALPHFQKNMQTHDFLNLFSKKT